jgi:hypothetical protein
MKSQYDVALSFGGEDRACVQETAEELTRLGLRVFYDRHEAVVTLWDKDLFGHVDLRSITPSALADMIRQKVNAISTRLSNNQVCNAMQRGSVDSPI